MEWHADTAVAAAAVCAAGGAYGWIWPLIVVLPLVPVGIALAVIDWRTRLLPTVLIRPMALAAIVLVVASALLTGDPGGLVRALIGFAVSGGLFWLLWVIYPRGMGFGDVRLSGVLGIVLGYLGMGPLLVGVYAGFLLGGVGGGLLSLLRIVQRRAFPFGPFMLVGAVIGVVWGGPILDRLVGA
jgi:leader peptidase (prepilin peptidase)/N-methyltransferase